MHKDDGGPAFPTPEDKFGAYSAGMTLRDWFAGQALAGLLASGPHDCDEHGLVHDAYLHADAMLKAREDHSAASDSVGRLRAALAEVEAENERLRGLVDNGVDKADAWDAVIAARRGGEG